MKFSLITSLLIFSALFLNGQNSSLTPDSALVFFNDNFPQEKVYLQSDRSQYIASETIWMKAWCTQSGMPSFLSHILYVDLVNKDGKVIQKKMYKLDSLSSTSSDIDIPANAAPGNYTLRAYTLWMLNFPDFIFSKNIYIYNVGYKEDTKTTVPAINVFFFPEGGDLVAGVKNRVAFKAVNERGFPIELKGIINDGSGGQVTDFNSEHDGLGVFELTPEKGQQYIAAVTDVKGAALKFRLPASRNEGIALNVENSNPARLFVVLNRADENKAKYNNLRIVAQMNYQVVFNAKVNIDNGESTISIAKKKLPAGIMQITVFDDLNQPLAERIVFIENYQVVKPAVEWSMVNLYARQKNELSFKLDEAALTSFSCLITDASLDTTIGEDENIVSSLLATSDLRGYVHNPGYYFMDKSVTRLHHLDLLLMTQGWRRFKWENIAKGEFPELKYPVESGMSVGGKVNKSDSKQLVTEGNVSFIIKGEDSTSMLADASITDKGEFLLSDVHFMKKATVSYMGTNKKKENYIVDVTINPAYIDSLSASLQRPQIDLDTLHVNDKKTSISNYLSQQLLFLDTSDKKAKSLEGFTVRAKKLSRPDSLSREYAEGPFQMGKSIDPGEYKFARTIWQIIQQAVPGVNVEGNPFDPNVSFSRFAGMGNGPEVDEETGVVLQENGVAYFLNGINVYKDDINTIAVSDVALIKVYKNEAAALGASQGAIAIYTKKGIVAGDRAYQKTYTSFKKEGYSIIKEFYAPDYNLEPDLNKNIKDNRYTLYFGSRLKERKDGKFHIRFFNNDIAKKYRIVIQGIEKSGRLVYYEHLMEK